MAKSKLSPKDRSNKRDAQAHTGSPITPPANEILPQYMLDDVDKYAAAGNEEITGPVDDDYQPSSIDFRPGFFERVLQAIIDAHPADSITPEQRLDRAYEALLGENDRI